MLKIYSFDDEEDLVEEASNLLDVGEFQLFQLSYESWFHRQAELKSLERVFFAYLLENRTPVWVRHYARRIKRLAEEGTLDSLNPDYHRFDCGKHTPLSHGLARVLLVLFAVVCIVVFSVMIGLLWDVIPDDDPCLFPPCTWLETATDSMEQKQGPSGL